MENKLRERHFMARRSKRRLFAITEAEVQYIFPAMATNYDEFMDADQAESEAAEAALTPEAREVLGIEPGRDGYMRWLLSLGGY